MTRQIFSQVKFSISTSLPAQRQNELKELLKANGASLVDVAEATHIISNTLQFEGNERATDSVNIVTDIWVERSLLNGKLLDAKLFSADPQMLFSGVILCCADLETCDKEVVAAGVNALGGLFRDGYTRDCTHVLAVRPGSDKYKTAMHYKGVTQVHVVLPHWFDDCFKLFVRLPEVNYAWPDPPLLRKDHSLSKSHLPPITKALVKTAVLEDEPEPARIAALNRSQQDIWGGKFVLLSSSLNLSDGRREAVEASVRRAGGVIVQHSGDEAIDVAQADVYIIQHRIGIPFVKAVRMYKTIGTLSWLFNVHKLGLISRPEDQLVHFPTNMGHIPGFETQKITATNYEGDARRYLKKLIEIMGGEFTPQMTSSNTIVIAAFLGGEKANKAREWDIPVVNHTWLEDCFTSWSIRSPAQEKYIKFPPGVNFGTLVGTRGIVPISEEELNEIEHIAGLQDRAKSSVSDVTAISEVASKTADNLSHTRRHAKSPEAIMHDLTLKSVAGDANEKHDEDRGLTGVEKTSLLPSPKKMNKLRSPVKSKKADPSGIHNVSNNMELDEMGGKIETSTPNSRTGARKRLATEGSITVDDDNRKENKVTNRDDHIRVRGKAKPASQNGENGEADISRGRTINTVKPKILTRSKSRTSMAEEKKKRSRSSRRSVSRITGSERKKSSPSRPKNTISHLDLVNNQLLSSDEELTPVQPILDGKPIPPDSVTVHLGNGSDSDSGPSNRTKLKGEPSQTTVSRHELTGTPRRRLNSRSSVPGPNLSQKVVVEILSPRKSLSRVNSTSAGGVEIDPSLSRKKQTPVLKNNYSCASPLSSPRTSAQDQSKENQMVEYDTTYSHSRPEPFIDLAATQRTPSKRQAASKAATKLHESASDMNQYEKERRSGVIRGPWEEKNARGKAKQGNELDKKKRRISAINETNAEPENRGKKRRKSETNGGGENGKSNILSDDEIEGSQASRSVDSTDISMMTTQVTLSDAVLKGLRQLGVNITTKPTECNLLVTNSIGRTEKFLCAMATARHIVTEKWAHDSVKAKRLMPPEEYLLTDQEREKKYNFKLADALNRSRSSGQKLLSGHTFYITKSLQKSNKLSTYKNVIISAGGKVVTQNPTARILRGHTERHILSIEEDNAITDALKKEGFHIYVPEFILMGVLTQRMDYDSTPHRLDNN